MDWFLYDIGLRHERVKGSLEINKWKAHEHVYRQYIIPIDFYPLCSMLLQYHQWNITNDQMHSHQVFPQV